MGSGFSNGCMVVLLTLRVDCSLVTLFTTNLYLIDTAHLFLYTHYMNIT
jgi:hypothetical protein